MMKNMCNDKALSVCYDGFAIGWAALRKEQYGSNHYTNRNKHRAIGCFSYKPA